MKITLLACMVFTCLVSHAQDTIAKNEIQISVGMTGYDRFEYGSEEDRGIRQLALSLGYQRDILARVSVGCRIGLTYSSWEGIASVQYTDIYTNNDKVAVGTAHRSRRRVFILPNIQYYLLRRERVDLYLRGGVGFGFLISSGEFYDPPQVTASWAYDYRTIDFEVMADIGAGASFYLSDHFGVHVGFGFKTNLVHAGCSFRW